MAHFLGLIKIEISHYKTALKKERKRGTEREKEREGKERYQPIIRHIT